MIKIPRRALMGGMLLGIAGGWMPTAVRAQTLAAAELLHALRQGGLVVYFRHGATTWSGVDQVDWPRERQRLLSPEGVAQARVIGEVFRRHALPVGEVLASPFARCRDMAEIAFGRVEERTELLGLLSEDKDQSKRIEFSRSLLRRTVPAGDNRVIVGHSSNISRSSGVSLPEGGAVIVRPGGGADEFSVLGSLSPEDWYRLNDT